MTQANWQAAQFLHSKVTQQQVENVGGARCCMCAAAL